MNELSGKLIEAIPAKRSDAKSNIIRSLKSLREMAGVTEDEMAHRIGISVETISEIERFDKIQTEHIKRYARALGANLRLNYLNATATGFQICLKDTSDNGAGDGNPPGHQRILPFFDEELLPKARDIVLSIHPQYSSLILAGEKTVELRRRFPVSCVAGTIAYIYSTMPVQALVGKVEISGVEKLPVCEIWSKYNTAAGSEQKNFDLYFAGLKEGAVLKLKNAQALSRLFYLPELKKRFGFEPPQSFVYARSDLIGALENE